MKAGGYLGLALVGLVTLWLLLRGKARPPEEILPPGEIPPEEMPEEGVPPEGVQVVPWQFSNPSYEIVPSWGEWSQVNYTVDVENIGNAPATKTVSQYQKRVDMLGGEWRILNTNTVTLVPGEKVTLAPSPNTFLTYPGMVWQVFVRDSDGFESAILTTK